MGNEKVSSIINWSIRISTHFQNYQWYLAYKWKRSMIMIIHVDCRIRQDLNILGSQLDQYRNSHCVNNFDLLPPIFFLDHTRPPYFSIRLCINRFNVVFAETKIICRCVNRFHLVVCRQILYSRAQTNNFYSAVRKQIRCGQHE